MNKFSFLLYYLESVAQDIIKINNITNNVKNTLLIIFGYCEADLNDSTDENSKDLD